MFVVSGVTGNTGRVVASTLLEAGHKVRVIVRDKEKGAPWREKGAEVAVASLDNAAAMTRALEGATGAYTIIPPDLQTTDYLGHGRHVIDALAAALRTVPVPHVVYLSSIGAHFEKGTGPIRTQYYAEGVLRKLPTNFTFIRASYFMENLAMLLGAVQHQGVLPSFVSTDRKSYMVATEDIGKVAAHSLLEPPSATEVIELTGPVEYDFNDAATTLARLLGKPVQAVRVPDEGIVPALLAAGVSEEVAKQYFEMSQGWERGLLSFEGGAARFVRGTKTLEEVLRGLVG